MNAYLPLREAARAVLLDADHRVLLPRYAEQGGYWATPGGSLEEGETHAAATLRELDEELGISPTSVQLGMPLAQRSTEHLIGEREVGQVERYFSSTPPRPTSTWTKPLNATAFSLSFNLRAGFNLRLAILMRNLWVTLLGWTT